MLKHVANISTETKVTGLREENIQPNAVDLRVAKVELVGEGDFYLFDNDKKHRETVEILPEMMTIDGKEMKMFHLLPSYYKITLDHRIEVGVHESGWTVPRSTLIRNGVIIFTALYDSGYKGPMVCGMLVTSGDFYLEHDARIAQYICTDAESVNLYKGSYQEAKA